MREAPDGLPRAISSLTARARTSSVPLLRAILNGSSSVISSAFARLDGSGFAGFRRGDLFERRRRLMAEWARYCEQKPVESESPAVVALRP
jgi:hypothetical protein